MREAVALLLFIFTACVQVSGWGYKGHQITALVAKNFLDVQVTNVTETILNNERLEYAITWPDRIKSYLGYNRSYSELHYVDTKDDPPNVCHVNFNKDCADNHCVVGAIENFGHSLKSCIPKLASRISENLSSWRLRYYSIYEILRLSTVPSYPITCQEELKYLIHLIGDVHQPLHASGKDRGGNDYILRLGRRQYNLHALWDSELLNNRLNTEFKGSMDAYVWYLTKKYRGYKVEECSKGPLSSARDAHRLSNVLCPRFWAVQSNSLNCFYVWNGVENRTVSEDYVANADTVIEVQLYKAGYRMASVLNELFGSISKSSPSYFRSQ